MATIPYLTANDLRNIDRWMVEEHNMTIPLLMEYAGLNVALMAKQRLGNLEDKKITILCGKGHNGGDGLVAARHLSNWGASVSIVLSSAEAELTSVSKDQLHRIKTWNLSIKTAGTCDEHIKESDLLIDSLLGFGIEGNPRGSIALLIDKANQSAKPILAVDTPSGLDTSTGTVNKPCIKAICTLTLAMPKKGFLAESAQTVLGDLYLGDIGVPLSMLQQKFGYTGRPLFESHSIIKL